MPFPMEALDSTSVVRMLPDLSTIKTTCALFGSAPRSRPEELAKSSPGSGANWSSSSSLNFSSSSSSSPSHSSMQALPVASRTAIGLPFISSQAESALRSTSECVLRSRSADIIWFCQASSAELDAVMDAKVVPEPTHRAIEGLPALVADVVPSLAHMPALLALVEAHAAFEQLPPGHVQAALTGLLFMAPSRSQ